MTIKLSANILSLAQKQAAAAGYADDVEAYVGSLIEDADELAETWDAIEEGIAQAEAGLGRPAHEVMAEMAKRYNIPTDNP